MCRCSGVAIPGGCVTSETPSAPPVSAAPDEVLEQRPHRPRPRPAARPVDDDRPDLLQRLRVHDVSSIGPKALRTNALRWHAWPTPSRDAPTAHPPGTRRRRPPATPCCGRRGRCSPRRGTPPRRSPRSRRRRASRSTPCTRASGASRSCCSRCTTWSSPGGDQPVPAAGRDYVRDVRAAVGARAKLETYAAALGRRLPAAVPLQEALEVAGRTDPGCRRVHEELVGPAPGEHAAAGRGAARHRRAARRPAGRDRRRPALDDEQPGRLPLAHPRPRSRAVRARWWPTCGCGPSWPR